MNEIMSIGALLRLELQMWLETDLLFKGIDLKWLKLKLETSLITQSISHVPLFWDLCKQLLGKNIILAVCLLQFSTREDVNHSCAIMC